MFQVLVITAIVMLLSAATASADTVPSDSDGAQDVLAADFAGNVDAAGNRRTIARRIRLVS